MKFESGIKLSLVNANSEDLISNLEGVSNKLDVVSLIINSCRIGVLSGYLLNVFTNLIELNLSNCYIYNLNKNTFEYLTQLKSIDLSNNAISLIHFGLFEKNNNLRSVKLQYNLLNTISHTTFSVLEILDLSYNFISQLNNGSINCSKLQILHLNNNYLENINSLHSNNLSNLTNLALNNNKIQNVDEKVFTQFTNLQYLDLSSNNLRDIHMQAFWNLKKLHKLNLGNNFLTRCITKGLLHQNHNLVDIDLTGNNNSNITRATFENCQQLKFLKLAVANQFEISSIKPLSQLTEFELFYQLKYEFNLTKNFWIAFRSKNLLSVLKLMFQKLYSFTLCDFSNIVNLKKLHIECLEPNDTFRDIRFSTNFLGLINLETLVLRKLNYFTVSNCDFLGNKLTYLSLAGVKNKSIKNTFFTYGHLEYLDLSFSNIEVLNEDSFDCLLHLEHLELGFSKLKAIRYQTFKNNCRLQVINCSNCRIESIDEYSFSNLSNLTLLDLSNNFLKHFPKKMFYGLNRETCIILYDKV